MSPKNIENIRNFEGRGLILVACKKSCIQEKIRNSVLGFSRKYYYKPVLILEIFFLDISYYNFFRFLSPLNIFFYINKLKRRQKKKKTLHVICLEKYSLYCIETSLPKNSALTLQSFVLWHLRKAIFSDLQ